MQASITQFIMLQMPNLISTNHVLLLTCGVPDRSSVLVVTGHKHPGTLIRNKLIFLIIRHVQSKTGQLATLPNTLILTSLILSTNVFKTIMLHCCCSSQSFRKLNIKTTKIVLYDMLINKLGNVGLKKHFLE